MRIFRRTIFTLLFFAMALSAALTVSAADIKTVKEDGKIYGYSGETLLKNKWGTSGKKTYYFGSDGAAKTGWYTAKRNGKYSIFYFDKNGVLKTSKTKKIDQKLVKLLDKRIKSCGASKLTDQEEILSTLFDSVVKNGSYARDTQINKKSGWVFTDAKKMLKTGRGACYQYAAAFAALARRATGLEVRAAIGKSCAFRKGYWQIHAWTEVKIDGVWYVYDTNAADYSSRKLTFKKALRKDVYGSVYKNAKYTKVLF